MAGEAESSLLLQEITPYSQEAVWGLKRAEELCVFWAGRQIGPLI